MILVTGASASGKSAFAEERLVSLGEQRRIYLATMIAWDAECRERIRIHRRKRSGRGFETIECPVDTGRADVPEKSVLLLECMSNLAANELYREDLGTEKKTPEAAAERIRAGIRHLEKRTENLVIVTNEVFEDGILCGPETERYLALLGGLNSWLAERASEVWEVVCGIPLRIKGAGGNAAETDQLAQLADSLGNLRKKETGGSGMRLVTGGVHQGKFSFARTFFDADPQISDGRTDPEETAFERPLIYHMEEYVRRFSGEPDGREKLHEFLERIPAENPEAVIVSCAVGCGIVPMEAADRRFRDLAGEADQFLAARASEVYRVICGIPQRLK